MTLTHLVLLQIGHQNIKMPRKYERKSDQQTWDHVAMQNAIRAVKQDKMPFSTAAKQFNVPRNTLKRRVLGKNRDAVDDKKVMGSLRSVFNEQQEQEICDYIFEMETRFYGVSNSDLRRLAFQLAERNNLPHRFNKDSEMAGKDWIACFRERHPNISLRKPEATSLARAQAFNRVNVEKFFGILQSVQEKQFHPAHRIYNVDETGLLTVQTKHTKVFALKGRRQVGAITSAERGLLSTFEVCMSAGGHFIPPFVVFPRQRMKNELKDGAPPGTKFACHPSGWMNSEIFLEWFDHFLMHTKPTAQDPVLLILDGHATHTKNINFIDKAKENYTTVICLPPHCTHKLQPLDVAFMASFKTFYTQACEKFLRNNPGRTITQFQISSLLNEAFLRAAVPMTAINGFRKCGIFPLDPNVFTDEDFAAAEVTDIPVYPDNNAASSSINMPSSSCGSSQRPTDVPSSSCGSSQRPLDVPSSNENSFQNPVDVAANLSSEVGCSQIPPRRLHISPKDIKPIPKVQSLKQRQTNRKKGKAAILTSSPYKSELAEEIRKKEEGLSLRKRKLEERQVKKANKELQKQQTKAKKIKTQPKTNKLPVKKKLFKEEGDVSDDGDDDTNCFYCREAYSRSRANEGWIRCSICKDWAHEQCAGCEEEDDEFTCEFCK